MSKLLKTMEGKMVGRIMHADKTFGRARIFESVSGLMGEYILSQIVQNMGLKENDKVDIVKITDKKGRMFMEVHKKK